MTDAQREARRLEMEKQIKRPLKCFSPDQAGY